MIREFVKQRLQIKEASDDVAGPRVVPSLHDAATFPNHIKVHRVHTDAGGSGQLIASPVADVHAALGRDTQSFAAAQIVRRIRLDLPGPT